VSGPPSRARAATATEEATASRLEDVRADGRLDHGAAAAQTEELYREHGRLVGGLCRALLRDPAEGEDAAQQVFLAAHRALLNGTSPREPAAWLATIARNECWARIRSRMREPLPTAEVEGECSLSDPLAEAIRKADLAAIWHAIAGLPRQQRDVLLLREFGGLSYEELAGALAVSDSAVESLLFRARRGVRARVEAAYAGLTGGVTLDILARLAGGFGAGAAPVAAKVAAVGVGAAVATGGAVVGPRYLERHGQHPPTATVPAATPPKAQAPAAAAALPIFVPRSPASERTVSPRSGPGGGHHDGEAASGEDRHRDDGRGRDADDGASQGRDRSGRRDDTSVSGHDRATGESRRRGNRHESAADEDRRGHASSSRGDGSSGRDDSVSGDDSAARGNESSGDRGDSSGGRGDSSGSGHGSTEGSGSDDGGVLVPVPNPVDTVTLSPVTVPPGDDPPGKGGQGFSDGTEGTVRST
jgi:RNA polymerase sigma-70 factor, ECF subfamily